MPSKAGMLCIMLCRIQQTTAMLVLIAPKLIFVCLRLPYCFPCAGCKDPFPRTSASARCPLQSYFPPLDQRRIRLPTRTEMFMA